jgi:hypothetical protein
MLKLSEPRIIERGPYKVVGVYSPFEGNDEGPGWAAADQGYFSRRAEVTNAADSLVLGFLYRPHRDHPEMPEAVRACFVGAEVTDLDQVPAGMSTTQFSGGQYAIVECLGDNGDESAMGVGEAIGFLEKTWLPEHGFVEGDACFAAGDMNAVRPPYVEYVYMKIEKKP